MWYACISSETSCTFVWLRKSINLIAKATGLPNLDDIDNDDYNKYSIGDYLSNALFSKDKDDEWFINLVFNIFQLLGISEQLKKCNFRVRLKKPK